MLQGVRKWATMKSSFMLSVLLPTVLSARRCSSCRSVVTGPTLRLPLPEFLPRAFFVPAASVLTSLHVLTSLRVQTSQGVPTGNPACVSTMRLESKHNWLKHASVQVPCTAACSIKTSQSATTCASCACEGAARVRTWGRFANCDVVQLVLCLARPKVAVEVRQVLCRRFPQRVVLAAWQEGIKEGRSEGDNVPLGSLLEQRMIPVAQMACFGVLLLGGVAVDDVVVSLHRGCVEAKANMQAPRRPNFRNTECNWHTMKHANVLMRQSGPTLSLKLTQLAQQREGRWARGRTARGGQLQMYKAFMPSRFAWSM
jgi:hypothetical protein